ncbi:rhomboid-like protein [Streptomyces sp. NPDC091292]|uniref:rhomboid-like protein n=1 Tax=Streptomyces sp. NPDC091292 TaxID=3365991 RepID=UPI003827DDC8
MTTASAADTATGPDGETEGSVPVLDGIPGQPGAVAVRAPEPRPAPALVLARAAVRLLPTPTGTPFTFFYGLVLALTSLFAQYAEPSLVSALLHGSSTDVAHLAARPGLVLMASALWIAGGITSPYTIGFLVVLTALERRVGAWRTAGVFLLGHVVATLATELPVGASVLLGDLPDTSLHRLDYGISFGVAAGVGALAGLLRPWLRWLVLAATGWYLLTDLLTLSDPISNWGHPLALALGICTWPLLRGGTPADREERALRAA